MEEQLQNTETKYRVLVEVELSNGHVLTYQTDAKTFQLGSEDVRRVRVNAVRKARELADSVGLSLVSWKARERRTRVETVKRIYRSHSTVACGEFDA